MKVAITMNEDSHFIAILTSKREECIKMLKSIDEGDIWSDYADYALRVFNSLKSCDEKGVKLGMLKCPLEEFERYLRFFERRGKFEIVSLQ